MAVVNPPVFFFALKTSAEQKQYRPKYFPYVFGVFRVNPLLEAIIPCSNGSFAGLLAQGDKQSGLSTWNYNDTALLTVMYHVQRSLYWSMSLCICLLLIILWLEVTKFQWYVVAVGSTKLKTVEDDQNWTSRVCCKTLIGRSWPNHL